MKKIMVLLLVVFSIYCFSQDSTFVANINTQVKITKTNEIRLGLGVNHAFYSELGYAKHITRVGCTGYLSKGYYVGLEWLPETPNFDNVYALKTGYEIITMLGAIGLEAKYQTDFNEKDVVLTPKIGFGLLSYVFLSYGYNVSIRNQPFPNVGKHQLSITFNIPIRKK